MNLPTDLVRARYDSPLGPMLLAASDRAGGLAGVWFDAQRHWPAAAAHWPLRQDHPLLREAAAQLDAYFAGERIGFELPLSFPASATAFQRRVWDALVAIPHGGTASYGELAARIGAPAAVRAVGAAVGRNPLGIVVPCHRVIGKDGSLTGYAGGIERKRALLRLEGVLHAAGGRAPSRVQSFTPV